MIVGGATIEAAISYFGPERCDLKDVKCVVAKPPQAETALKNAKKIAGNCAIIHRGLVTFPDKARRAEAAGAIAVIFVNHDTQPVRPDLIPQDARTTIALSS